MLWYRHHFLLLGAEGGGKLAKLHGSIPFSAVRARFGGEALCGILARAAGLVDDARPIAARALIERFDWARVPREDRVATWDGQSLAITEMPARA